MRLRTLLFAVGVLVVTACATREPLTVQRATPLAFKALGQGTMLYWVEGASHPVAGAMARLALPGDAPAVTRLAQFITATSQRPVRIAVAGTDSAYTAKVIRLALSAAPGDLPLLQLAFVGDQAHEAEVRRAVDAKRGSFVFAAAPSS